jgi:hypothetical protein
VAVLLHEGAEPLDVALDDLAPLGLRRRPDLALLEIGGPGALVGLHRGRHRIDGEDRGDVAVQQRQVVGDDQDAAGEGGQELGQPGLGVGVQVVGRLVQEQGGRLAEQHPGQLDAAALATRQLRQGPVEQVVVQPEAGRDPAGLGLGPVAALQLEAVLEVAEALHGPVAGAGVAGGVDPGPGPFQLVAQHVNPAGAQQPGQAGRLRGRGRLLRQPAEGADQGHLTAAAGVGRGGGDRAQRRRLPRPVRPDQPDHVARGDREGHLIGQQLVAGFDSQIVDLEHSRASVGADWWGQRAGPAPVHRSR